MNRQVIKGSNNSLIGEPYEEEILVGILMVGLLTLKINKGPTTDFLEI